MVGKSGRIAFFHLILGPILDLVVFLVIIDIIDFQTWFILRICKTLCIHAVVDEASNGFATFKKTIRSAESDLIHILSSHYAIRPIVENLFYYYANFHYVNSRNYSRFTKHSCLYYYRKIGKERSIADSSIYQRLINRIPRMHSPFRHLPILLLFQYTRRF